MLRRVCRRLCAAAAPERLVEEFDVVVVGGGPAGLAAALRLKQLAGGREDFRVALVDKGSEIGAHTLSGACIETHALDELLPNWRDDPDHPIRQKVTHDTFLMLSETSSFSIPQFLIPPTLHNDKNYIVQLGAVCKWLGEKVAEAGVEIFPGFAAAAPVYSEDGKTLEGVQLHDVGINKKGERTDRYEPGMIFRAKQTILAEGCRGSVTKKVEERFKLRVNPKNGHKIIQTYGLGVKELWEVPKEHHKPGSIVHSAGWPLTAKGHDNTYGGSFMYQFGDGLLAAGFIVGLDYSNPYIRPFMELQKWKTHPHIRPYFEGAKPIGYGARTLVEGGYTSLPKLHFPGGVLIGDSAGFLNLPKIKGTHTAMKSGLIAAEAIWADAFKAGADAERAKGFDCAGYDARFRESWLYKELYAVRNCRQAFTTNFFYGMAYTGLTTMLLHGAEPWTFEHHKPDHECLKPAAQCVEIEYPKPDGKLTFDLLTDHSRSGTTHNADQPAHLRLRNPDVPVATNLTVYAGPEGRYCPAGVYEFVDDDSAAAGTLKKKLVINAQNCVHCKACDIKDPTQNIDWSTPEGAGGPNYSGQM